MAISRMMFAAFLSFVSSFILAVAAVKGDSVAVNIAAAYNSELGDGWARFVYWQDPNGTIYIKNRGSGPHTPEQIENGAKPKGYSPLAALDRPTSEGATGHNVSLMSLLLDLTRS